MPSSYTHILWSAEPVSFETFALRCARAMGACVSMRDDSLDTPIPDRFEPNPYYAERAQKAAAEVARIETMTLHEASKEAWEQYHSAYQSACEHNRKNAELNARYEKMLASVRSWEPPTSDHQGLKQFMLEQLEASISGDCYQRELPVPVDPVRWLHEQRAEAYRSLGWANESLSKEIARVNARNVWLGQLRASLATRETP